MDWSDSRFWVAKSGCTNVRPSSDANGEGRDFCKKRGLAVLKRRGRTWKKSLITQRRSKWLVKSISKHCLWERWLPLVGCPQFFSPTAKAVRKTRFPSNALSMLYAGGQTKEYIQMLEDKYVPQGESSRPSKAWLPAGGRVGAQEVPTLRPSDLANKMQDASLNLNFSYATNLFLSMSHAKSGIYLY